MSCCNNNTSHSHECDPENEPLSSALNNFITSFYGSLSKTCVNGQVVWTLPCNLDAGDPLFPRNSGEGLSCYFLRFMEAFSTQQQFAIGNKGYRLTVLTGTDVVLYRNIDVINQDFTGTLTEATNIYISSNGAQNGDEFYLSFDDVVISDVNILTILSDSVPLLALFAPPGTTRTVNGFLKAVYTGTAWKLTLTSINLS